MYEINPPRAQPVRFATDVETTAAGFRLMGASNRFSGSKVSGYAADASGSRVYRGIVLQLPTRKGCQRYVAGYTDGVSVVVDRASVFVDDRASSAAVVTIAQIRKAGMALARAAVAADKLSELEAGSGYRRDLLRRRWDAFQSRRETTLAA